MVYGGQLAGPSGGLRSAGRALVWTPASAGVTG